MAHVMQCDICNDIYDKPNDDVMHNGSFTVLMERHSFGDTTHCCPKCTRTIEDFINALKNGEPYRLCMGEDLVQKIDHLLGVDATCQE